MGFQRETTLIAGNFRYTHPGTDRGNEGDLIAGFMDGKAEGIESAGHIGHRSRCENSDFGWVHKRWCKLLRTSCRMQTG